MWLYVHNLIPSKASYFSYGKAGTNLILPEFNTPVETVTTQIFALIVPWFVSTLTPLPFHLILIPKYLQHLFIKFLK